MIADYERKSANSDEFPDPDQEVGTQERAARLRVAVDGAGGNATVARRIGMPLSTIGRYLAGREMKASAMIALAQATGVRLEWLATGMGPRTAADAEQAPSGPPVSNARTLFSQINADRLAEAYEMASKALAAHGHRNPEPRRLVQVMVLIYDELNSAAESSPSNNPQDSQPLIHEGS